MYTVCVYVYTHICIYIYIYILYIYIYIYRERERDKESYTYMMILDGEHGSREIGRGGAPGAFCVRRPKQQQEDLMFISLLFLLLLVFMFPCSSCSFVCNSYPFSLLCCFCSLAPLSSQIQRIINVKESHVIIMLESPIISLNLL